MPQVPLCADLAAGGGRGAVGPGRPPRPPPPSPLPAPRSSASPAAWSARRAAPGLPRGPTEAHCPPTGGRRTPPRRRRWTDRGHLTAERGHPSDEVTRVTGNTTTDHLGAQRHGVIRSRRRRLTTSGRLEGVNVAARVGHRLPKVGH